LSVKRYLENDLQTNTDCKMIYELYIEIKGFEPRIWRKIQVDANIKLDELHHVIQVAMGWTNSHLYSFMIGGSEYSLKEYEVDTEYQDSKKCGLTEIPEDKFQYVYDFGDYWEHQIEIVQKLRGKGPTSAICVDGRGKCPPEDVGGIPGYMEFLKAMKDDNHPERDSYIEWYGSVFDPRDLRIPRINYLLSLI